MANENERFLTLRKKLFEEIRAQLEIDSHCKSYEGAFEITKCYPNYFDEEYGEEAGFLWVIELHCYVVGPYRHYRWDGKTFGEALSKAEAEIYSWMDGDEDGK